MKIDLEKAYDRLNWDTLHDAGIPENMIEFVWQCISTPTINNVLDLFCRSFGQRVSKEKTRVYFSENVSWQVKQQIRKAWVYHHTSNLGRYLGIPILHNRVTRDIFQFIIGKVNQRLSGWKARQLSFVGRVTLTKSVLLAIPSYVMMLPSSICDAVEKKVSCFYLG